MANTLLKLGGVAVAIGGAYLYMKNKGKKEQAQALASMQVAENTSQPAVTTDAGTYTKDEAKKLAMSVVEKTIKLYDEIPKDRLADKHRSVIQEEEFKAKQDEYNKVKALAKSKNQKSFTYLGETYNTADGRPINSGSNSFGFFNPYEGGTSRVTMSFGDKFFIPKTLGDQANKFKKSQGWVEQYDFLVNAFTKMPKSQVDALLPSLPKMYFTAQPYAYLQEYLEKNPYSMQETLLFREANLEQYKPHRDSVLGIKIKEFQSATANAGIK